MEVCPVCGEQRRNSARFCTTCGHRFAADEMANTQSPPAIPDVNPGPHDGAEPEISGWPAAAPRAEASPWAPSVKDGGGWPALPIEPEANSDATDVTWADVAASAFSSPKHVRKATELPAESDAEDEFESITEVDAETAQTDAGHDDLLRERARTLVSELGEVIEGLTGHSSSASDDLASDLEISLTRPAALDGEALADLRAAAESAQDRPRDLDTLTALTAQSDTILALIVAYERASAGIERAIESIRGGPGTTED
ncbi:MAG: hypothetical protein M3Z20_20525 [Chloroflexota bacterium]|nr:hypothetical protein [Chloroflexota bacterium]